MNADRMLTTLRGLQNERPKLKETVSKLAAIVEEINKTKSQRRELESERGRIVSDQTRIRSNLQSVGQGTDLGRRYLDTLKTQEDRLVEIGKSETDLQKQVEAKEQAAGEVAKQLTL
jgi:hypothetical protein